MQMRSGIKDKFKKFERSIDLNGLVLECSNELGLDRVELKASFLRALSEAANTVDFLQSYSLEGKRLLEIGSGAGLLGAFLVHEGLDLFMLEPGGTGFDLNSKLIEVTSRFFGLSPGRILRHSVHDLSPTLEKFDFIFSNNVLEHVPDVEAALKILSGALAPNGMMVHNCPNYIVPFEPHYGIPLIPFFPSLTALLLPQSIKKEGCWNSLNFIRASQIKKVARMSDSRVKFRRHLIFWAFFRFKVDSEFCLKHPGLSRLAAFLDKFKLLQLLKLIPYQLSTPMIFEWRRN